MHNLVLGAITSNELKMFYPGLFLVFIALLVFHFTEKKTLAVLLLLFGTLLLRLFDIYLDSFLNNWDEQFHALVAKNLSQHMLKPTLYPKEILPYDYTDWSGNFIWVHKQPLFLWQSAIAIKIFGAKVFAIRIPSALLFTFSTYCLYKTGKNLVNPLIGFYAAVLFLFNFYFSELCAGSAATDLNDSAFVCYIFASVWAFSEHIKAPAKKRWVILIGLFSACAILNKWLVGLLVYLIWGLFIVFTTPYKQWLLPKTYKTLFFSLIVTVALSAPWQIYCFTHFPQETKHEMALNSRHLTEAVEGHTAGYYYYYDVLSENYGKLSALFIVPGFIFLYRFFQNKKLYAAFLTSTLLIYAFYTLIPTKMPAFTLLVSFFIFLSFGSIFYFLIEKWPPLPQFRFIVLILLFSSALFAYKPCEKKELHNTNSVKPIISEVRKNEIKWKQYCLHLKEILPDKNYIIFNCIGFQHIKLMYYSDFIAYGGVPNEEHLKIIEAKGYKAAIFDDDKVPREYYNNPRIKIISRIH